MTTPQPRADVCRKLGLSWREDPQGRLIVAPDLDQYKEAVRAKIAALHPDIIRYHNFQWEYFDGLGWWRCRRNDPTYDLNACHEWEGMLTLRQQYEYRRYLADAVINFVVGDNIWPLVHATALQRCDARILSAASDKPSVPSEAENQILDV